MPTATRDNNNKNNSTKQRKPTKNKNEHQLKESTEAAFIMNKWIQRFYSGRGILDLISEEIEIFMCFFPVLV